MQTEESKPPDRTTKDAMPAGAVLLDAVLLDAVPLDAVPLDDSVAWQGPMLSGPAYFAGPDMDLVFRK